MPTLFEQKGSGVPYKPQTNSLSGYLQTQKSTPKVQLSGLGSALPPVSGSLASVVGGGTNQGMIPKATTPLKSVTTPDGNKIEYHAPVKNESGDTNATNVQARNQATQVAGSTSSVDQKPYLDGSGNNTNTNPNASFPGLINSIADKSSQPSADYNRIQGQIAENLAKQRQLTQDYAQKDKNIQGTAGFLTQATGLEGLLNRQYGLGQSALSNEYSGLSSQLGAANTQQQTQQSGLISAAGLAQPQLGNIGSQQYYNPLNQGGSATGTLPQQAQDFVNSLAQQVMAGSMTRGDAESRLSTYGVTGIQALNNALGSNFNTNASNASAATTAQGQQIGTFATSANAALDKLESDFNNLPTTLKAGIPATIGIEQWLGQSLGNQSLSTYQTTLHDARAQLSGVLSTAGGMTPTSAEDTAKTYLPDNMTAGQLSSKIAAARALVQQKVDAFQQSGKQNQGGSNNQTTGFNW